MKRKFEHRLDRLFGSASPGLLADGLKGIEKESLRVTHDGEIAQTPHPRALGSALTNPYITTDYSEALLEFITPPFRDIRETLNFLSEVHRFVYSKLESEMLWATSMPCLIHGEESIPIAYYGTSNVGTMKHVYRRGLEYRYGRTMQAIAGVHFNYSLPKSFWPVYHDIEGDTRPLQDFVSGAYFGLIRNFQRQGWLISYLFGASPAVCGSFFSEQPRNFSMFDAHTFFKPFATSLRMSDIGYKNKAQANLNISYNDLDDYVRSLTRAIETPYPEYVKLGVRDNGEYRQLNANLLQIENEYYSFVRPKQVMKSGEKPTLAMKHRGVAYVEIRALDVDLFNPLGVNEDQLRLLEMFLILCLLQESPTISAAEREEYEHNQRMVACYGRDPSLTMRHHGSTRTLHDWAAEIFDGMQPVAELLDAGGSESQYTRALAAHRPLIDDAERTPSARVLAEMHANEQSFFTFAMDVSKRHQARFADDPLSAGRLTYFDDVAQTSLRKQQEIETSDRLSFEEYLADYFTQH